MWRITRNIHVNNLVEKGISMNGQHLESRYWFIELHAFWQGLVNSRHITEYFQISRTIYRDRWYLLTPIYFGKNKSCGPTVYELTLFIASRLRSTLSTFQKSVDSGLHSDFPKNVDSGLHFFYNFMQH